MAGLCGEGKITILNTRSVPILLSPRSTDFYSDGNDISFRVKNNSIFVYLKIYITVIF